jgi:hypothetical protein
MEGGGKAPCVLMADAGYEINGLNGTELTYNEITPEYTEKKKINFECYLISSRIYIHNVCTEKFTHDTDRDFC